MTQSIIDIRLETPADKDLINQLHEITLGPGRYARTAYRLREKKEQRPDLCFSVFVAEKLIGSIQFTNVWLNDQRGLLLGPLAIHPDFKNQGFGIKLMQHSINVAQSLNESWIILVGDEPYYNRVGFKTVRPGSIQLPGPVDPNRLLMLQLDQDIELKELSGRLE